MITVSVIMTTYGQEKFIAEAINGVLLQECDFEVEVIVADDNSPDNTEAVVKQLLKNHPRKNRVKYTKHGFNKGMMVNGVWALNQCKGKYIALCEGDDYWTDSLKLQKQVAFLEKNKDYGLVFTDFDIYYNEAKTFRRDVFKRQLMPVYYTFEEHLLNAGFLAPCTWLCRKELVPQIDAECADGSYYWMLNVLAKSKIKFLEANNTAVYRVLTESASKSLSIHKRFEFLKGVFQVQKEYLKKQQQRNVILNKIYSKAYLSIFPLAVMLGKDSFIEESRQFWGQNRNSLKEKLFYKLSNFKFSKSIFIFLYQSKNVLRRYFGGLIMNKSNIWTQPKKNNKFR